jgi:hypothetical protein
LRAVTGSDMTLTNIHAYFRGDFTGVEQNAKKPDITVARELRGQILVWFGIVGGAMTIANH